MSQCSDKPFVLVRNAMTPDEAMEDPTVARLQHDLGFMQGHLTALRSSADTMLTEAATSAKRPRLTEGEMGDGSAITGSKAGPMEPFGSARK